MRRTQLSALALLAAAWLGCNDDSGGEADTEAMCGGYGEDPDPCCCFPAPGVAACDELQLCPTIEADCEDGTLGTGTCVLDMASDGALTCALTALGDAGAQGSLAWTIRESDGAKVSAGTLHLGGGRAALEVSTVQGDDTNELAFVGALPSDFDAQACTAFETPGQRFECMLNVTALQDAVTCQDEAATSG